MPYGRVCIPNESSVPWQVASGGREDLKSVESSSGVGFWQTGAADSTTAAEATTTAPNAPDHSPGMVQVFIHYSDTNTSRWPTYCSHDKRHIAVWGKYQRLRV